jgi:cardiolipin synthase
VSGRDDALLAQIAAVAADTTPEALPPALAWLRRLGADDLGDAHPGGLGLPADLVERLQRLLVVWRAHPIPGEAMAFALEAAVAAVAQERRRETSQLVFTGPDSTGARWRRMDEALLEVCAAARGRLILTTYSASPRTELLDALRAAIARGVTPWIFLEKKEETGGWLEKDGVAVFRAALGSQAKLYVWPIEQRPTNSRGKPGLLHAKVAVADDAVTLISSANLSDAAVERNIEAGVLVRGGPIPATLRGHFEALVRDGVVVNLGGCP